VTLTSVRALLFFMSALFIGLIACRVHNKKLRRHLNLAAFALRFYAAESNWRFRDRNGPPPIQGDQGKRARAALIQIDGGAVL